MQENSDFSEQASAQPPAADSPQKASSQQLSANSLKEGVVILFDKPLTWTSFDVVRKVKNVLRPPKIGHAGTLDPLATGLLVLCTGRKTKDIERIQAQEKEYEGTFRLGQTTPSFDRETPVDAEAPYAHLTDAQVRAAAAAFLGRQQQVPPLFSAVKVQGERAYELARRGATDAAVQSKTIEITLFELTRVALPEVDFRLVCSKGTYVRSLARDLGRALGCGAHLTRLVRTRIGEFHLADAWTLAGLEAQRPARPTPDAAGAPPSGQPRRERRPARSRPGLDYFAAQQNGPADGPAPA